MENKHNFVIFMNNRFWKSTLYSIVTDLNMRTLHEVLYWEGTGLTYSAGHQFRCI